MNAREFVADMAARQETAERSRSSQQPADNRWRWHYTAYLFPEALCPYCVVKARREGRPVGEAALHSNRIWLVDNAKTLLVGQLALVDGQVVVEHPQHPHVAYKREGFTNGYICTGSTFSISHALFSAIEPDDTLWVGGATAIPSWLATMFDHDCPNAPDYAAGCADASCSLTFDECKPNHGLDGEVLCERHFRRRYFRCRTCHGNGNREWQRRSDGCWEDRDGYNYCTEHKAAAERRPVRSSSMDADQLDPDCTWGCHCDECRSAGDCICGDYGF